MTNYISPVKRAFQRGASGFFAVAVMFGSIFPTMSEASSGTPVAGSLPKANLAVAKAQSGTNRHSPTRVYGHSVIPGGVRGSSELISALERDKLVKAHYANFDAANAYVVPAKSAKMVYVSYRLGNEIYWTKNKVRLAKGEALLTDGKSFIRARCGNRIAEMSQPMVSSKEPAPEVLDTVSNSTPDAVSQTSSSPTGTGQSPLVVHGLSSNGKDAAANSPVRVSLPTVATGINDEILEALVPASSPELRQLYQSLPLSDILPVRVERDSPAMGTPEIGVGSTTETVLATFPSALSDFDLPAQRGLADNATELPEPSSFPLLIVALFLIALIRRVYPARQKVFQDGGLHGGRTTGNRARTATRKPSVEFSLPA